MKAAVLTGPKQIEVKEVPVAELSPGDIRIKVSATGVCGSDIHMWMAGKGWNPNHTGDFWMGHEFCGVVTDPGTSDFKVGERVVFWANLYCGECDMCKAGLEHLCRDVNGTIYIGFVCNGAYAEEFVGPARLAYRLPDNVTDTAAALIDPLMVAYHAIHQAKMQLNDKVLVVGTGIIAQMMGELAKKAGYRDLQEIIAANETLKAGDKVYAVNMKKAIVLFNIGSEPISTGMNILGAHIDSPRLDIKQNPMYEDSDLVLLDTHYYGGIKKYQWVAIPLALHGVVALKNGECVEVVIGEDVCDAVVGVSDLLIHLAAKQMEKKGSSVVEGEDLDILIGSMPAASDSDNTDENKEEKEAVKKNILAILKEKYGIEEEDFLSAELEAVPAGPARDYGLDRSMIMGYGHDDRVCAYPSLIALLNTPQVTRTGVCILVDKEEIGSVGATGMHSRFFENMVAEVMDRCGDYSELKLRRALANSYMLSSDVSAAYDPNYASVFEKKNSAFFGKGMVFNKYTGSRGKSGSNDANAEYLAKIRGVMDDADVSYQFAELGKVDAGGGGTIAYIMANYGMEVIDSGVAVLSMHAPWEVTSKADVYEAYKGYVAFLKNM